MKRHRDGQRGERLESPGEGAPPRRAPSAGGPNPLASAANSPAHPTSGGFAGFLARCSNRGWLPGLLLVLGTVLAYQPVWHGGFLWDDDFHITKNRMLVAADGWKQIWSSPESPQYYPLVFSSFRLERTLWGLNPTGYHWVNILLHAASAVWLWRVLRRLNVPGAWLAAAVFALHPVNVESVAWISQRKNTLAMCFYLLSVLCYLRFDPGPRPATLAPRPLDRPQPSTLNPQPLWYWLALAAFALALLSKTAVSPFPLVLLGLAWWRRGTVSGKDVWRSVPFFMASLLLSLVTIWFERHQTATHLIRDDSFWSRLAVAGWAVWFYLWKALLPIRLIFIYPRWQCDASQPLSYFPGALLVGALLLLWWRRERWGRVWLFAAGYYAGMLLPVLGFVNIGFMSYSLVADHWQYFAIIAPIAAAATGIASCSRCLRKPRPWLGAALGGALLLTLGGLTWRQSELYVNAETLWCGTLAANPQCWPARYELGLVRLKSGSLDDAIANFQEALQYQPNYAEDRNNIGYVLQCKGAVDDAIAQYHEALRINPNLEEAHNNLGSALLQKGALDDAIAQCTRALQIKADYPEAHNNLGIALVQKGKVDEAISHYQAALRSEPDYANAHNNLGTAFAQQGRMAEARTQYQEAHRLAPGDPQTCNNLALLLATCGDASLRNGTEAVRLARKANDAAGGQDPRFLRTLAAAFAETGRFADAVQSAQKALELAKAAGQQDLAARLKGELKRYEAGLPLRQ